MTEIITFFEDNSLKNFHPLTLTRPIYDLRVGILTLGEKWLRTFGTDAQPRGLQRDNLKQLFPEPPSLKSADSCYWVNPRVFPDENIVHRVQKLAANSVLMDGDTIIAAHLSAEIHNTWLKNGLDTADLNESTFSDSYKLLENVWQIFQFNGD